MSSSSDEDFVLLDSVHTKIKKVKQGIHEINRNRKDYGEYHHLFSELKQDPCRFFQYTRMTLETFNYILEKIEQRLTKTWCNWHTQPILPEERLVITLRYLATGLSFKALSFTFRMGATTVGKIVSETVVALWEQLHQEHMPIPTEDTFSSIAEEFYNIWKFPNCLGSIDGKHVRIVCPNKTGSMYFNYKKFFSVVLQGVVDARYKFITIDVGGYGKQSDGGTFQASELYNALKEKKLKIPEPAFLPQTNVKAPYVFVGDEAYPLLPFLLKPYGGNNLTIEQDCYNKRLSRCRKTVECSFGILYSKWRLLSKCIETNVDLIDHIVKCMCVLHNTIIDKEGLDQHLTDVSVTQRNNGWQCLGRPSNEAKNIRDIFTAYFANNPLIYNA